MLLFYETSAHAKVQKCLTEVSDREEGLLGKAQICLQSFLPNTKDKNLLCLLFLLKYKKDSFEKAMNYDSIHLNGKNTINF